MEIDANLLNKEGIDIPALIKYKNENKGSLKGFPGAQDATKGILYETVDIFVPAATQKTITSENAGKMNCKIVAEAANGPTTPAADAELQKKGTIVIPDMFLNAGGVTVSYFEFIKGLQHVSFGKLTFKHEKDTIQQILESVEQSLACSSLTPPACVYPSELLQSRIAEASERDIVLSGLQFMMENTAKGIISTAEQYKLVEKKQIRIAAYCRAVEKIFKTYLDGGLYM